jgi:NDP-sugar pyrophosphorylase family protein
MPLKNVTAAILAGGLGTRLRSVISDRPKVLAPVHDRPFISFLLDQVADHGIRTAVLCVGYRGDQLRALLGECYGPLRLHYSAESSPLGTAGALRLALPLLQSETVLVLNGDSYCDARLQELYRQHLASGAVATLLVTMQEETRRYGRVNLDPRGTVSGFEEKGSHQGPGWINTGVYLIQRSLLPSIPTDRPFSLERDIFPAWVGCGLHGHSTCGRFLDIGTPESYAAADLFFAGERTHCSAGVGRPDEVPRTNTALPSQTRGIPDDH